MTNVQARLIAAALALIAGALYGLVPDGPVHRHLPVLAAAILFGVEYVRTQLPPPGRPTAPA